MAGGHEPRGRIPPQQLKDMILSGAVDTVISAITDMQGRLMGKRIQGEFFLDHAMEHGTHFCTYLLGTDMEMTTPDGFRLMNWDTGYGDWLARPDWNTLRLIPWLENTALVLADAVDEATGAEVPISPRTILSRQLARAREMGFAVKMATELEYYLLTDTFEAARKKGFAGLETFGWYNEDYHLLQGTKAEPFYRQLRNQMTRAGIPIEFSKGEAAPGQHEVNLHYADALEAADRHTLFKHGAKEMAWQNGFGITFMAKPDHGWTGSSGHIHVSLWDTAAEKPLFADPAAPQQMSATMRHFLGGLMHCARELSLFIAPNVNSYKRYAVASWAPVNIVWGRDNRTCGFRIVGHGRSLRIENRLPGGDTNPYLAYAAVVGAGLYGVANGIEPRAEHQGNGYTATGCPRVPRALYEAIDALERSRVAAEIFGEDVVQHYINAARVEQQAYDAVVHAWDRERYLERG